LFFQRDGKLAGRNAGGSSLGGLLPARITNRLPVKGVPYRWDYSGLRQAYSPQRLNGQAKRYNYEALISVIRPIRLKVKRLKMPGKSTIN